MTELLSMLSNVGSGCLAKGQSEHGDGLWKRHRAAFAWWLFLVSQVLLVLLSRSVQADSAEPTSASQPIVQAGSTNLLSAQTAPVAESSLPERIPPVEQEFVSPVAYHGLDVPGSAGLVSSKVRRQEPPDAPRTIEELPMPRQTVPQEELPGPPASSRQLAGEEKPLSALRLRLGPTAGELPTDGAGERFRATPQVLDGSMASRREVNTLFAWEAPALCHGPIYIQDVNLERYGYSHGALQPAYSAVHFLGSVAILPYLVGAYPQRECFYNLGYYRPGSYAPYQPSLPRPSLRGVAFEGGILTGMAFGVPGFIP